MPPARRRARTPAPLTHRNGLKWRDGRPRWEPSPASRKLGVKGKDLKDAAGDWMLRGDAIAAADKRALWAGFLREAHEGGRRGDEARSDLRRALDAMPPPTDAGDRHARQLVQDIIDAARLLLDGQDAAAGVRLTGAPRTVAAMVDGYFASPPSHVVASTLHTYRAVKKRILAEFGNRRVDELERGEIRQWYLKLLVELSPSTANLCVGALGAFYRWATWQVPAWVKDSPCTKLGTISAPGRRVFWTPEEELAFVPWCDANGYEDVADGAVTCLWTGARPIDACGADLPDLAASTWRYIPVKTKKSGIEALPAILPQVKARVERRERQALTSTRRAFLIRPSTGDRHNTASLGARFREAKAAALAERAVPLSFATKRMQDCRDTCLTRLADAGVALDRLWTWTAHSPDDAKDILRDHYISLLEGGSLEMGRQLEAWAGKYGLQLQQEG